jgi:hypothetical protein
VRHSVLGASTSTQLSTTVVNLRQVSIFGGQLFVSTGSGSAVRVGTVGSGLPTTSGQTISNLPGFPTSGSPYAFFFADLNAAVAGMDTLYVADDSVGITKYSFDGATWTVNGTNGIAGDAYRGLTGVQSGTTVTLYAARKGGSGTAGGGEIVSLVDDGTFSGVPTVLATAVANTAFRGIALTPAAGGTTSQPAITSIVLSGPDLILAGAGGTANTTFRVLSSTNITTTLDSWQPILTNTFDLNGQFTVTNAFSATEPQRFFILQTP